MLQVCLTDKNTTISQFFLWHSVIKTLTRHNPAAATGADSACVCRRCVQVSSRSARNWKSSAANRGESCGVWCEKQDEVSIKEVNGDETWRENEATAQIGRKIGLEEPSVAQTGAATHVRFHQSWLYRWFFSSEWINHFIYRMLKILTNTILEGAEPKEMSTGSLTAGWNTLASDVVVLVTYWSSLTWINALNLT